MKVIVTTCDKYKWLVPIFHHFYYRNWPDNPYETVLLTETEYIDSPITLYMGKIPWADRLIDYLEGSNEKTFMFLAEDYVIEELVKTSIVRQAEKLCVGDIGCVRVSAYNPLSKFLKPSDIDGFKEYPLDKPYSVSLQMAVWQKDFLLEILKKGESVWQTETEGSKRVRTSKYRILWAPEPAFQYVPHGYMQKGVVDKNVEQWIKENW